MIFQLKTLGGGYNLRAAYAGARTVVSLKRLKLEKIVALTFEDIQYGFFYNLYFDSFQDDDETEENDDYNKIMKELVFDPKKAKAQERLKTDEEIITDQKEMLEKLEELRQKRMKGEDIEENEQDEQDEQNEESEEEENEQEEDENEQSEDDQFSGNSFKDQSFGISQTKIAHRF